MVLANEAARVNIFSVNIDVPDVEAVLDSVAQALQDWEGGRQPGLDLSAVLGQTNTLNQQLTQLRSQANLDGRAIIHSTRPGLGPWIIRFQHMVRRLTWWFTEPIVFQIRMFENQATTVMTKLSQNDQHLVKHVAALTEQLAAAQDRLSALEARLASESEGNDGQTDGQQESHHHHPDLERS